MACECGCGRDVKPGKRFVHGHNKGNQREQVGRTALHYRARKHLGPACETCETTKRLQVHHVDRVPANNDPANLRTLCVTCHLKLHWAEEPRKRPRTPKIHELTCVVCDSAFTATAREHKPSQPKMTCSVDCKNELISRTNKATKKRAPLPGAPAVKTP